MIRVNEKFYEKGCTMDGIANRVMLKKDGKTCIEMTFNGEKVEIKTMEGEIKILEFYKICEITTGIFGLPVVRWKD